MSLTTQQEQTLSTFISMTQADVPVAKSFLKATSWDINTAMDRFFAFGGDASKLAPSKNNHHQQQQQQPNQPSIISATANLMQQAIGGIFGGGSVPPQSNNNNNNNNHSAMQINDFESISQQQQQQPQPPQPQSQPQQQQQQQQLSQTDSDALLAQQLAASQQPTMQQPTMHQQSYTGIRAPDVAYQERMVGPYINQYGSSIYKQRRDAEQNFAKDWQRGPRNEKSSFLGALFSDPTYKFIGSLEEAKKKGCRDNKWLIVNIQDTENFCSHCLNRDIWKDKELGPVIKESFIFYQWMKRTDNAKRVINLYHPYKFPCIFIIDPTTGRQEYKFNVPDSPDKINTLKPKLLEFLDNYPNPKAKPKAKPPQPQPQNSTNATNATNNNIINQPSSLNNHDEQLLQQAIQESLQQQQQQTDVKEEEEEDIKKEETQIQLLPQPDMNDPNATAIRIRMPNGSILQRLFKKDSKVNQLYIWCIMSLNGQKISLIQTMPRLKLDDERDKTLAELGLIRATLVCSYIH